MIMIKKANPVGFCWGVRRAINIAEDALKNKTKIYSFGPIIHNPLVVKELSSKGLEVIKDTDQALDGRILIRSHGIRPSVRKRIKANKIGIVDATCPFVKRSHRIVNNLKREGFYIIIAGEANHPEVAALAEAAGKNKRIVINSKQIKRLNLKNKEVALLAQSTLTKSLFEEIAQSLRDKNPAKLKVFDTICSDVAKRQYEAARLSKTVDLMLVIGGKVSANTKRLAELCKKEGVKTYHIETEKEIKNEWFKGAKSVGTISGSSTPNWIVDSVIARIKQINV